MANVVELQWKDTGIIKKLDHGKIKFDSKYGLPEDGVFNYKIPITEEISIEARSSFTGAADKFGLGGNIVNLVRTVTNVASVSGGRGSKINNLFDLQVWDNTEPLAIPLSLFFYVKDNPVYDVMVPVLSLTSTTVLRDPGSDQSYFTPGFNLSTYSKARHGGETNKITAPASEEDGEEQEYGVEKNGVLDYVRIPGVVKIKNCFTRSATPTFSKEVTESGIPLWAKLDIELSSALPASDFMLTDELLDKLKENKRKDSSFLSQVGDFLDSETPLGKIKSNF